MARLFGGRALSEALMHVSSFVYTPKFDFPTRREKPAIELMVASVPRSGSTAFCFELWRTGLLGAPLEYANLRLMKRQLRWKKSLRSELRYWSILQRVRTSPNGVFSYKFFVQDYNGLLQGAPKLIPRIAPTHVIYFTRKDKVAQAVSYSKAVKSGRWFATERGDNHPDYEREHVERFLNSVKQQESAWESIFRDTESVVFRTTYEELLVDRRGVVDRVLAHVLGSSDRSSPLNIPELSIQRDENSRDWLERFESGM